MVGRLAKKLYLLSATVLASTLASSADALVINNYFSYGIKDDPRHEAIMAAINYASNAFASKLSNDVTLNLQYSLSNSTGYLGTNGTPGDTYNKAYVQYLLEQNAIAHPENTVLATALAHLNSGNYANDSLQNMQVNTAQLRALGLESGGTFYSDCENDNGTHCFDLGGDTLPEGTYLDGVVILGRANQMLFGFDIPPYDDKVGESTIFFSAINTLQHEIMHILGGGLSVLDGTGSLAPLDMYRYSAPGVGNPTNEGYAYFSIDGGKTKIAQFNDRPYGDLNGFGPSGQCTSTMTGNGGPIGLFMDAFSCSNQPTVTFSLDSPEGIQLMALGWNPRVAAVPEPATWTMMLIGFGGVAAALRRRHRRWRCG